MKAGAREYQTDRPQPSLRYQSLDPGPACANRPFTTGGGAGAGDGLAASADGYGCAANAIQIAPSVDGADRLDRRCRPQGQLPLNGRP